MNRRRAFRPRVSEYLEERLVPSPAGVLQPTIVLGRALPALPQSLDADRARAAFDAFVQTYNRDVQLVLLAPGPDGSVNPAANRAAFDAVVVQALNDLADTLVADLDNASTASTSAVSTSAVSTSTDTTAADQVRAAITGPGPDSLQSQLIALPTTAIAQGASIQPLIMGSTQAASQAIARAAAPAVVPFRPRIAQGGTPAPRASSATTGAATATTPAAQATAGVRSAFATFLTDYSKAVRGVLLAAGPDRGVDPASQRAAFDAQVAGALRTLGDRLDGELSRYPATSPLVPRIRDAIAGDGPGSLKAKLAALPTPGGSEAATVRDFTLGSIQAIADALALVAGDVAQALNSL